MVDVYHATVDDLARTALQSLFYFNYLRGGLSGTGPSKSKLQLRHASRVGNSNHVVKLLDRVAVEASINTRVPHLEGETIFRSTKRKLDLPPGDDSDSHWHDCVNFSIPMLGKGMSPAQARGMGNAFVISSSRALPGSLDSSQCQDSILSNTTRSASPARSALTSSGLPLVELPCLDPTQLWRIEWILSNASDLCSVQSEGKRCNCKNCKVSSFHCGPNVYWNREVVKV